MPNGWSTHYIEPYSDATQLSDLHPGQGDCLLWGAMQMGSSEFSLAAFGDRAFVESLWDGDFMGWDNGVYWYAKAGKSAGFAGDELIQLQPGDDGQNSTNMAQRLSWHLTGVGGYRAGVNAPLDSSSMWKKIVMYGPVAKECEPSVCPPGKILKASFDLPGYCIGTNCTETECCRPAKRCQNDVCAAGYFPKPEGFPAYCPGTECLVADCCVEAPHCKKEVCPAGYLLKRVTFSPYGCSGYECKVSECCEEAPVCPRDFCNGDGSLLIKFVNPTPNCTDYTCSLSDCCKNAGACAPSLCPISYALSSAAAAGTVYCANETCEVEECCKLQPPTVPVTGVRLQDMDLDEGELGGNITWIPPASEELVTFYAVYMGVSVQSAAFVGNTSVVNASFALPTGRAATVNGVPVRVYVYAGNRAGLQASPAVADVADVVYEVENVTFADLDLDRYQIGGIISWRDPLDSAVGPEALVCRRNASLRVEVGLGGYPLVLSLGEERLPLQTPTWPGGFIAVAVLLRDDPSLDKATVQVFDLATEAAGMVDFIGTAQYDAPVLLAAFGSSISASRFSNATIDALRHLGAREFELLNDSDAYALVGRRGVPDTGAVRGVFEALVRAGSGRAAVAELGCPLARIEAYIANERNYGALVGSAMVDEHPEVLLPPETSLGAITQVIVRTASAYAVSTNFESIPLIDVSASVSDIRLQLDGDSSAAAFAGKVLWTPPNTTSVIGYSVFIGPVASGENATKVGQDVYYGTDYFEFPSGVERGNATHILVYTISQLARQSIPTAYELEGPSYYALALTIMVVATSAVLHFVRIVVAIELASQATSAAQKQSTTQFAEQTNVTSVLGTFESTAVSPPLVVTVSRASCREVPVVRDVLSTWFPSHVHHHPSCVLMRQSDYSLPTRLHRHMACDSTWDAEDVLLQQYSNASICVQRGKHKVVLKRRLHRCIRVMEDTKLRMTVRVYGPLVALLFISVAVLVMEELYVGVMLLSTNLLGFVLVYLAPRLPLIPEVQRAIAEMPPPRIRHNFWKGLDITTALLPMVPAAMSGTPIGYTVAATVLASALTTARGAPGLAFLLETPLGLSLAAVSLILRHDCPAPGTVADDGSAARYMASFFSAALLLIRTIDDSMAHINLLLDLKQVSDDELMTNAQDDSEVLGMSIHKVLMLEAFCAGHIQPHMHRRVPLALRELAGVLEKQAQSTLAVFAEELHGGHSKFAKYPHHLGAAVGEAIDSASADLGLKQLNKIRHADHHALDPEEKAAASQVFKKKTGPGLEKLEKKLHELVHGPLSQHSVTQGHTALQMMRTALTKLEAEVTIAQRCVGEDHAASDRARVDALGLYVDLLTATAQYVHQEVSRGSLSPTDARVLGVKIQQMLLQVESASDVIGDAVAPVGSPLQPGVLRASQADPLAVPREDLRRARNLLEALRDESSDSGWAPSKVELADIGANMSVLIKIAGSLKDFRCEFCEITPRAGVMETKAKDECELEVGHRMTGRKSQGAVVEVTDSLSLARSMVSAATVLLAELSATRDRVARAVSLLDSAHRDAERTLHATENVRSHMSKFIVADVQHMQDDAIRFATGHPVMAVTILQDLAGGPTQQAFASYKEHLRRLSVLLESPPSAPREAFLLDFGRKRSSRDGRGSRGSRSSHRSSRKSASRIQPTPVPEEDEVNGRESRRPSVFQQELRKAAADGRLDIAHHHHQPAA